MKVSQAVEYWLGYHKLQSKKNYPPSLLETVPKKHASHRNIMANQAKFDRSNNTADLGNKADF